MIKNAELKSEKSFEGNVTSSDKLIGISEILDLTDLSRPTIWRLRRQGRFPEGINIEGARRLVWLKSDVHAWIETQAKRGRA